MADDPQFSSNIANCHTVGSFDEFRREIPVILSQRKERLGWRRWLLRPAIVPYYHFGLSLISLVIMSVGARVLTGSNNYVIPSFIRDSNFLSTIKSQTMVYLDLSFAAIGLPLFCELIMDIIGHFLVENAGVNASKGTTAEKVKEWCLRLQFIVAFAMMSVVRLGPNSDDKLIVVNYTTQFLRLIFMGIFGMFTYTDTCDSTEFEYIRSLVLSTSLMTSLMLLCFVSIQEQTPTMLACSLSGKIMCSVCGAYMLCLFSYQYNSLFKRVRTQGGLASISSKEMCFVVYTVCIATGTMVIAIVMLKNNNDYYRVSVQDSIYHAVMMIIHAIAITSLPVRIAR